MRFNAILILTTSILMIVACDTKPRVKASNQDVMTGSKAQTAAHTIVVKEVLQANSYTYIYVSEGDAEYWIATAKQPLEVGMTLHYDKGMEMNDFTSKEIDRTFDSIFFVNQIRGTSSANARSGKNTMEALKDISVEKVPGSLSIAELYDNKAEYAGKMVTITGQVTKFNSGIMGRNWVHLQDGTTSGEDFDVTVTTTASVSKGDVVVFSGTVALDKDFGAGYIYDLIIEEAELSTES